MTALYIIGGIILFFVILFSIRLYVTLDYGDNTLVTVKWLFLTIPVYDSTKQGAKKKKKKKKEKPKKEPDNTAPATAQEKPQKKGNGLLKQLYLDQGYDGIEKMLYNTGKALGGFFGKLFKTFTIDELYLTMKVVGSDAADTALSYGKLSSWLFSVLGKLVSTCKVKKYDVDVSPDFLANKKEAHLYTKVHVTPIHVTNAVVVLAFALLFKVLLKVLFASQKSKKTAQPTATATPGAEEKVTQGENAQNNQNKTV